MEATLSIEALAGEAYAAFERKEHGDETTTTLRDDAPEWVRDAVYTTHGGMFPDDWKYDCIRSAFGAIHDDGSNLDIDELANEWADGYVDAYTGARLAWLASNLVRGGYVDEALDEYGAREVTDSTDLYELIGLGQYFEAREVFGYVQTALENELEARTA